MAILIGGVAHNLKVNTNATVYIVPTQSSNRRPKQERGHFSQCKYKRTNIVKDGERVYRFTSGYYLTQK